MTDALDKSLEVIDQATQPNVRLSRSDCVQVDYAIAVLRGAVAELRTLRSAAKPAEEAKDVAS